MATVISYTINFNGTNSYVDGSVEEWGSIYNGSPSIEENTIALNSEDTASSDFIDQYSDLLDVLETISAPASISFVAGETSGKVISSVSVSYSGIVAYDDGSVSSYGWIIEDLNLFDLTDPSQTLIDSVTFTGDVSPTEGANALADALLDLPEPYNGVLSGLGISDAVPSTATATATMLPVSLAVLVAPGSGYSVANELTVVGGTFSEAAVLTVDTVKTILSQSETDFAAGEGQGTFVAGASHVMGDVITMSDGTTVTVDAVGTGDVTAFTILSISTSAHAADGDTLTQSGTTGIGTGFSLTLGLVNQGVFAASVKLVTEIAVGVYTVLPADPVATTGEGNSPGGATFNLDWGVKAAAVTDGGSEYESVPDISVSDAGGGEEASLTAVLTDGVVTSIVVVTPGGGYVATAILAIDAP